MHHAIPQTYSFDAMFDSAAALAAISRASQWNLPRHICHPLDRMIRRTITPDLAAFDAEVDSALLAEEELPDDFPTAAHTLCAMDDADFDNEDDV